jgi:phosphate acetyltransferase
MGGFLDKMTDKARADVQTIVLPEGSDARVVQAARQVVDEGLARVVVLGALDEVAAHGVDLDDIEVVDPAASDRLEPYAQKLAELRAKKGMTLEQAREQVKDISYFAVMMVYMGDADGMVSGACHSTADTLRPALQILKTAPGVKIASSSFIMDVPDCQYGADGVFVVGDCAVNIYPTAAELADIALASAETFSALVGGEPRVAMLSYSSCGSGKGEHADLVREATALAKEAAPGLALDGELQADAAVVPQVAALKAPDNPVAGKANVLVFPNLDAGNIAYKLVQRLAKAKAYGPVMQGMAKPVNDLSRGCSVDDIVGTTAITCVQAQALKG